MPPSLTQPRRVFRMELVADVSHQGANPVTGLPAKTFEPKAGCPPACLPTSMGYYFNPQSRLRSNPKDFALRAACAQQEPITFSSLVAA
jgi:hypothetical protein